MIRSLNKVISSEYFTSEITNGGISTHLVVVDVIAGGKQFIECYFGVDKKHPFYSIYPFIEERDMRFKHVQENVFTNFGAKKEFKSYGEIKFLKPLDGAWLSFARTGKTYDYLNDDYFYYGAGFNVGLNAICTDDECFKAANVINDRMMDHLGKISKNGYPVTSECLPEDVWKMLKRTSFWGQHVYDYNGTSTKITKTLIDENIKPALYDFIKESNQKMYIIRGTSICISCDGMIRKDSYYNRSTLVEKKVNLLYSDAVHDGLSKDGLSEDDIKIVGEMLCDVRRSPYWIGVISKLHRRLNKHDRNNIKFVLSRHYGI